MELEDMLVLETSYLFSEGSKPQRFRYLFQSQFQMCMVDLTHQIL